MSESKTSCVERARPATDEDEQPDGTTGSGDGMESHTLGTRRRNPFGTAQRHQRDLWEEVFSGCFRELMKIRGFPPNVCISEAIHESAGHADEAVREWKRRFEPGAVCAPTAEPTAPLGCEIPAGQNGSLDSQEIEAPSQQSRCCSTEKDV